MFEIENNYINHRDEIKNNAITKVFFRMFLGLLATTITAVFAYTSKVYLTVPYGLLAIAEFVIVLLFTFLFKKLSSTGVTILFYLYAFVNGLTLSVIFAVFEIGTIFYAFGASALLFGLLSIYGYTTKRDLSKIGPIFLMGLLVALVIYVVNLFLRIGFIETILDWALIFIFCGLTAYDIHKMQLLQETVGCESEKLYIYCAMDLYLDFINIFLRILSIMGRRRD